MANIVLKFVTVLREVSERISGTALPTEITLQILFQWGGMESPTAQALQEDAGGRRVRDCILRHSRAALPHQFGGIECYCDTHKMGTIWAKYNSDQLKCLGEYLEDGERVPKQLRVRRVNAHLRRHRQPCGIDDNWYGGDCGTFWLWFRYLQNQHPDDEQLKEFGGIDFGARRMQKNMTTKLSLSLVPEPFHPSYGGAMRVWGKMIEELQGQPVRTEIKNYAEGWRLYLRADAGEIL